MISNKSKYTILTQLSLNTNQGFVDQSWFLSYEDKTSLQ